MEDNSFVLDTMTWSFTRINNFSSGCRREWKAHYIDYDKICDSFDGQVGSVGHKTFEAYFKGEIDEFDMSRYFEDLYKKEVTMQCPYPNGDTKYGKILEYFDNFSFDKNKFEILGVEKKIKFQIGKYNCVGYIDLLLQNKETGEIIIVDQKSATIRIKKNGEISKSDQDHFLSFKRQLYLYSKEVLREYGKVDYLAWNMFKDGTFIKIPWDKNEYEDTLKWAEETIQSIEKETEFPPNPSYYYCSNLCCIRQNHTCPYKRLGMIYDGIKSKCCNPKNKEYEEYGGAGIGLFEDWKNDKQKFFAWALENGYEDGLVLKRYDETLDYDFFNCYWDRREISDEYYNSEIW